MHSPKSPSSRWTERLARELQLDRRTVLDLWQSHGPLAERVARARKLSVGPLVVAISGPQGSGKSTLCGLLQSMLEQIWGLRACGFSIDDFYLTRAARRQLARRRHPLLITRGVPGTHQVDLALDVLEKLRAEEGSEVMVPRFDKATDDRFPESQWQRVPTPVDVVVFEGWCVAVPAQPEDDLSAPINRLEQLEDADGRWRRYVNERLSSDYRRWFEHIDFLVYLRPPGFDSVRTWRKLQEVKLARRRPGAGGLMNDESLDRFLMHFERVTRHAMQELPKRAHWLVQLDGEHRVIGSYESALDGYSSDACRSADDACSD